jgi:putative CocE/NonD family hydrolase
MSLTSVTHEVRIARNVRIPSSTAGLALAADLYLPQTPVAVPALVTLHYGRRTMGARCYRYFAERGYACVVVDCRGVGGSGGVPRPPLDPREGDDGAAVIDWVSRQPWCTGKTGMWGLSYGAALALATASRRPPNLHAVFSLMGFTDTERDLVHPGGLRGGLGFTSFSCVEEMLNDLLPPVRGEYLAARRQEWLGKLEVFEPWLVDAWRHAPGDPEWRSRTVDVTAIEAPVFCVGGWRDLFCLATVRAFEAITAPKRLLIGPWLHDLPENSPVAPVDSMALACDWWERWLSPDSEPGSADQRVTVFIQRGTESGHWAELAAWPSAGGPTGSADTAAAFAATAGAGLVRVRRDRPATSGPAAPARVTPAACPADPTVGALSGLWTLPVSDLGYPLDQHDDDRRSLSFTSAPLTEPLLIAGQPEVALAVAPAATASRYVIKLADVAPSGQSTVICTGLTAAPGKTGSAAALPVRLDPSCYEVPAGHRLRLVVADSDFPRLWPSSANACLAVNVTQAGEDGSGEPAAPGCAGLPVTVVTVPVGGVGARGPVDLPALPASDNRGAVKFAGQPAWRICRDHCQGSLSVTLGTSQPRLFTPDEERIRVRDFTASALVSQTDPAAAAMTASGRFVIDSQAGEHVVVRTAMEVGPVSGTLHGEVLIDGKAVFTRTWSMPL